MYIKKKVSNSSLSMQTVSPVPLSVALPTVSYALKISQTVAVFDESGARNSDTLLIISGKNGQNPFVALQIENWRKQAVRMLRRCLPLNKGVDWSQKDFKKFVWGLFRFEPNSSVFLICFTSYSRIDLLVFIRKIFLRISSVAASSPLEKVNFGDSVSTNFKKNAQTKFGREQTRRNSRQGLYSMPRKAISKVHFWLIMSTAKVGSDKLVIE